MKKLYSISPTISEFHTQNPGFDRTKLTSTEYHNMQKCRIL